MAIQYKELNKAAVPTLSSINAAASFQVDGCVQLADGARANDNSSCGHGRVAVWCGHLQAYKVREIYTVERVPRIDCHIRRARGVVACHACPERTLAIDCHIALDCDSDDVVTSTHLMEEVRSRFKIARLTYIAISSIASMEFNPYVNLQRTSVTSFHRFAPLVDRV